MSGGPRSVGAGVRTCVTVASAVAVPILLLLAVLGSPASAARSLSATPSDEAAVVAPQDSRSCMAASHGTADHHRVSPTACGFDLPPVILAPLVAVVVLALLAAAGTDQWLAGQVLPLLVARAPPARSA